MCCYAILSQRERERIFCSQAQDSLVAESMSVAGGSKFSKTPKFSANNGPGTKIFTKKIGPPDRAWQDQNSGDRPLNFPWHYIQKAVLQRW